MDELDRACEPRRRRRALLDAQRAALEREPRDLRTGRVEHGEAGNPAAAVERVGRGRRAGPTGGRDAGARHQDHGRLDADGRRGIERGGQVDRHRKLDFLAAGAAADPAPIATDRLPVRTLPREDVELEVEGGVAGDVAGRELRVDHELAAGEAGARCRGRQCVRLHRVDDGRLSDRRHVPGDLCACGRAVRVPDRPEPDVPGGAVDRLAGAEEIRERSLVRLRAGFGARGRAPDELHGAAGDGRRRRTVIVATTRTQWQHGAIRRRSCRAGSPGLLAPSAGPCPARATPSR